MQEPIPKLQMQNFQNFLTNQIFSKQKSINK